jgi:hypothetical protein
MKLIYDSDKYKFSSGSWADFEFLLPINLQRWVEIMSILQN